MAYRVFLSHSSKDNEATAKVADALRAVEMEVFVDFDPKRGLQEGDDWKTRLYTEMRRADVFVGLMTEAWAKSDYCQRELGAAEALERIVVGLAVNGDVAPVPQDLRSVQVVEVSPKGHVEGNRVLNAIEALRARRELDPSVRGPCVVHASIDRVSQKRALRENVPAGAQPLLVMLHGERGQGHDTLAEIIVAFARRGKRGISAPSEWLSPSAKVVWPHSTLPPSVRWAKLIEACAKCVSVRPDGGEEALVKGLTRERSRGLVLRHVLDDLVPDDLALLARYRSEIWEPVAAATPRPWVVATLEVVLPPRPAWWQFWPWGRVGVAHRRWTVADRLSAQLPHGADGLSGLALDLLHPLSLADIAHAIKRSVRDDDLGELLTADAAEAHARRVLEETGGRFDEVVAKLQQEDFSP